MYLAHHELESVMMMMMMIIIVIIINIREQKKVKTESAPEQPP